jgi:hypothetical protein
MDGGSHCGGVEIAHRLKPMLQRANCARRMGHPRVFLWIGKAHNQDGCTTVMVAQIGEAVVGAERNPRSHMQHRHVGHPEERRKEVVRIQFVGAAALRVAQDQQGCRWALDGVGSVVLKRELGSRTPRLEEPGLVGPEVGDVVGVEEPG